MPYIFILRHIKKIKKKFKNILLLHSIDFHLWLLVTPISPKYITVLLYTVVHGACTLVYSQKSLK